MKKKLWVEVLGLLLSLSFVFLLSRCGSGVGPTVEIDIRTTKF